VSHYFENEDLLADVQDANNQPVLVAPNVEDDTIADAAGIAKSALYIGPRMPTNGLIADVGVPCPQWPFCIPVGM
jgi:hypothetical protein